MIEYKINQWEQIGENLFRRPSTGYEIYDDKTIFMEKVGGRWITREEYEKLIEDMPGGDYDSLMRQELANQEPFDFAGFFSSLTFPQEIRVL